MLSLDFRFLKERFRFFQDHPKGAMCKIFTQELTKMIKSFDVMSKDVYVSC